MVRLEREQSEFQPCVRKSDCGTICVYSRVYYRVGEILQLHFPSIC